MKKWLYNFFNPYNFVIYIGIFFIVISLIYLVFFDGFNSNIAYALYPIMSYFFVILCIKIYKLLNVIIYYIIKNNKYLTIYVNDYKLRYKFSLFFSFLLNIIYVLFKLISGICYKSIWFISFALYYLLLVILRFNLVKMELSDIVTLKDEYLKYRKCGILLLFMNVILAIIILVIVNNNIIVIYPDYIAITIAAYTFYLLIWGIVNLIRYRKYKSPLMKAAKIINVVASFISLLSLEVVMLSTFGMENVNFNEIMIIATGGGISIVIIVISFYMIIEATEWLNNN